MPEITSVFEGFEQENNIDQIESEVIQSIKEKT
jgi:hypothetical protein